MESLARLGPELEHYTDKVKALQEVCSLHQELELARKIDATIQARANGPLHDLLR